MISGDEIRSARERAHLTQQQLGALVGVTFRTVGNWERGETIPRNREAAIRSALADYFDDAAPVTLRVAADAELLAEIARRFGRLTSSTAVLRDIDYLPKERERKFVKSEGKPIGREPRPESAQPPSGDPQHQVRP